MNRPDDQHSTEVPLAGLDLPDRSLSEYPPPEHDGERFTDIVADPGGGDGRGASVNVPVDEQEVEESVRIPQGNDVSGPTGEPPVAQETRPPPTLRRSWGRRKYDLAHRVIIASSIAMGVVLGLLCLRYVSLILVPFAVLLLLAYLLNPICMIFRRVSRNRHVVVAMTVFACGLIVSGSLWLALPVMADQTHRFIRDFHRLWVEVHENAAIEIGHHGVPLWAPEDLLRPLPEAQLAGKSASGWQEFLGVWQQYLGSREMTRTDAIVAMREAASGSYAGTVIVKTIRFVALRDWNALVNGAIERVLGNGTRALLIIWGAAFAVGLFVVATAYLLIFLNESAARAQASLPYTPGNYRRVLADFAGEYHQVMNQYLSRQTIAAILTGVLFAVGFWCVGLPMPVPMGAFMGALSLIPYLQIAGLGPAITLAVFQAFYARVPFTPLLLGILVTFAVVQLIQVLVFKPYIVGSGRVTECMGILVGAFLWPELLGWTGFVFAIPVTGAIIAGYRLKARWATGLARAGL